MECRWNKRPLERQILKGIANGWYANYLIWPKALDQRVEQGDLIGQVRVVSDLSPKQSPTDLEKYIPQTMGVQYHDSLVWI